MSDMAERLALHEFTENAYLNYSMYVIMTVRCRLLVMV